MDREREDPVREFRLEGFGLLMIGALLLAAVAGAFFLGRWYERQSMPADLVPGEQQRDPLGAVEEGEPTDAAQDLTFFDTLSGEGKEAEPSREATPRPEADSVDEQTGSAAETAAPTPRPRSTGAFAVQVFAGRDRRSAEALVVRLAEQDHEAWLDSESEGADRLYKVRVGGYPTREEAQSAAKRLQEKGFSGAWVVRLE